MDENTLNDLLECSVCLERLDESKVLPCQHTFCRKCLEVIFASRQELRCPECRVLVNVRIDDLPPNVLLMRILEGLKNAAANKTQPQKDNQIDEKQKLNHPQQQQLPQQAQTTQQKAQTVLSSTTQRRCLLPHAYALYDFESSEPTDLHFKKGDLILLKQKIDINWFVGQLNGVEGTFPSNYVQVIVPLSSPQCIALYDFKMGPNEEEGCLNFKKGSVIHVLRRVDQNWAEGRIGNMIGIFPIAFVELNALAKQLLDSFEPKPRTLPSAATTTTQNVAARKSQSQNIQNTSKLNTSQQTRNLPPIPMLDLTMNSSDTTTSPSSSSLSNITSPSVSDSATSSNSLPNSPQQSLPTTPQHAHTSGSVRYRNGREKRHSLNALLTSGSSTTPALSILQTNRHSAEILSIDHNESIISFDSSAHQQDPYTQSSTAMPQSSIAREQRQSSGLPTTTPTTSTRANVLKTACGHSNIPASLPWGYLALYPYKPRKHDELELKKGCVYIVTERCLDGWFKGKNWQDISGVFPGNYVTPLRARDQQQLMHQWKYVPQQQQQQQQQLNQPSFQLATSNQSNNSNKNPAQPTAIHQIPPELPPRNIVAVTTTTTCASVWTKPLSHTVEAFFNRSNASEQAANNEKNKEKESKSKDSSTTSAAVSLMKRLTHIKSRAKSPANVSRNQTVSPSMQQANVLAANSNVVENINTEDIIEQASINATNTQLASIHHVRSGSCPSQLLQNLPHDGTNSQLQLSERFPKSLQQTQQQSSTIYNHGSERIKGHKERPRIQTARQSMDGTSRNGIYSNVNVTATSLNSKCSQQYQQLQQQFNNTPIYGVSHRKSQSLDANNFIMGAANSGNNAAITTAAPPPLMPMPNCISAAAIAASATTKSTHAGRESRFRCIVPYPPNSDVELELHVGDIIYVQRKQKNGWYKGTHAHTQKTGLFPASFVEPDI